MIGEIRQNFTEASASVGLILATALKGCRYASHVDHDSVTVKKNNRPTKDLLHPSGKPAFYHYY